MSLATVDKEILKEKQEVWGAMGVAVHQTDMQLQARQQAAVKNVKLPTVITEIEAAEQTLSFLTKEHSAVKAMRMSITSKFDELFSKLMEPEKAIDAKKKELQEAIIKVKKVEQDRLAKENARLDELKKLKEYVIMQVTEIDAAFKTRISNFVNKAYQAALNQPIAPSDVEDFIAVQLDKITVDHFKINIMHPHLINTTKEDFEAIMSEHCKLTPEHFLSLVDTDLKKQFSDYEVAYHNRQQAIDLANKEAAEKAAAIQQEKQNKEIAAKLESVAAPVQTSIEFKALKRGYEVDMPETVQSALAIMSAFAANIDKCMPKLKVTKWFAFTPGQAAIALAKVKCDDNAFQSAGINFKEVAKL